MLIILRLGHRIKRDERLSTHCGLVARALGASKIIFSGEHDESLVNSVNEVSERWGGSFTAEYESNWKKVISNYKKKKFAMVHLTMYGLPVQKEIRKIRKKKNLLIIIGSEKVPGEVYQSADYNIAVGSQPHSEVAALSIFLHEYFKGKELDKKFSKARIKIVPQECGKRVVEKK